MDSSAVPAALARYRPTIELALQDSIPEGDSPLTQAARYVMGWEDPDGRPSETGGKRIRPALCLLAAEALGGKAEDAIPGAVALELVHNFSLVHDEIQDRDTERHHRPTAWALFGEAQAINIGDYLYSRAIAALLDADLSPSRRDLVLRALTHAIDRMIAGQWEDIEFEAQPRVGVADYAAMVGGKTGAMLAASVQVGAILAGAEEEVTAAVAEWGLQVGLAFQVWDDYLGIWGNPDYTGKSDWSDIRRKKKTYPVVLAMADGRTAELLDQVFAMDEVDEAAAREAARAIEFVGGRSGTREAAERYAAAAEGLLAGVPIGEDEREHLRAIANYLVRRDA